MNNNERMLINREIYRSSRNDYRHYVESILNDIAKEYRNNNLSEIIRLSKTLTKTNKTRIMPSKDNLGNPICSAEGLLSAWNKFLSKKFQTPQCDVGRPRENIVSEELPLTDEELDKALFNLKPGKAPGWDEIPVELYQSSISARTELYRIIKMIWSSEEIPPDLVKGIFIMLYKKKDRNNFANYRAICLLCHAYKLLSAVIATKLQVELNAFLPDSQAGFRPNRGTIYVF